MTPLSRKTTKAEQRNEKLGCANKCLKQNTLKSAGSGDTMHLIAETWSEKAGLGYLFHAGDQRLMTLTEAALNNCP